MDDKSDDDDDEHELLLKVKAVVSAHSLATNLKARVQVLAADEPDVAAELLRCLRVGAHTPAGRYLRSLLSNLASSVKAYSNGH